MAPSKRLASALLFALFIVFASQTVIAGTFVARIGEDFVRDTGAPITETRSFSVQDPTIPYVIRVYNGGRNGQYDDVSSAIIALNGVEIFQPDDFNQKVRLLERSVSLREANTLSVELRSKPGSGITIEFIGIDNAPPTITAAVDPPPNAAGWNNTNFTVTFKCFDASSGIASCTAPVTVTTETPNRAIQGTAVDGAGNTATASVVVRLDKTPPKIETAASPQPNANGWNNSDVTVAFTATDNLSGVAVVSPAATVTTEGSNQAVTGVARDIADNVASATVKINLDKTPPVIQPSAAPQPNAGGWNNSDVTVTFTANDALSGIATVTSPILVNTEGSDQNIAGVATDRAGNSANASLKVRLDKTPPVLSITSPASGAVLNTPTSSLTGTATDALSGLAALTCNGSPLAAQSPFSCNVSLNPGSNALGAAAMDLAGNPATISVNVSYVPNQPPSVNAGPDQTIKLPATANLHGTATDDGLPAGAALTITWIKVSGPGTVTFANPAAASTTASFSEAGTYVLRLSAADTQFTSNDDVIVTVNPGAFPPQITSTAIKEFTLTPSQSGGEPVSLGPWTVQQYNMDQGPANWVKDLVNNTATQTLNSDASILLSDFDFSYGQIEGTWSVNTGSDDDHIGFVFGYQDSQHFYLFDWKQEDQGDPLGFAERGMSLKIVNADSPLTGSDFWPTAGNGARVRTVYHNTIPWNDFTPYRFTLRFAAGDIHITVNDGNTVLADISIKDPTYVNGRFGFYNYSQAQVKYTGFVRSSLFKGTYKYDVEATDPDSNTLTYSLVTAPAGMTIDPPTGLITWPVSSTDAGVHNVSVRVDDPGGLFDTQSYPLTIVVPNLPPAVNAGPDQIVSLPTATLHGTAADDGFPQGGRLNIAWSKVSGPGTVTFNPANALNTTATFSLPGDYVLRLTVDDGALQTTDDIAISVVSVTFTPAQAVPGQTISVTVAGGPVTPLDWVGVYRAGTADTLYLDWKYLSNSRSVPPAGIRPATITFGAPGSAGDYDFRFFANNGYTRLGISSILKVVVNQPPAVNAGPDQTVNLPAGATLSGVVTDDGLPGATLTITWSKISGPGLVTFASPNAASTTATFSQAGTYVLRLTANDSQFSISDDITVKVNPPDQAPVVNAGPDLTITLPDAATLNGVVTDDGLPPGSTITVSWSKVSGPGVVTFVNTTTASTAATFSQAGTYVLRLTASDTQLTSFDDVTVTVNAPANLPPVVNAGPDQSVTLPNRAMLNGLVTDDGKPTGGSLVQSWTKFSGPGNVYFTAPNAAVTQAGFSSAGTYVLRLTGNDGQLSSFDDVQVVVSGTPPPAPTAGMSTPANGSEVTGPINVLGSVSSTALDSWTLEYKMIGDAAFRPIASGTASVTNALLGTFDPTQSLNGIVVLQLRVTDTTGQVSTSQTNLIVTGNQKVGNFTVSFRDLTVPMAGFPIDIVRTYDSRLQRAGDFGMGWTLDIKAVQLSESQTLGSSWQETKSSDIFPTYCLQETRPHIVTVTLQDGTVHKFRPTVTPECRQFVPIESVTIGFQPLPGTNASLSIPPLDVMVSGSIPGPVELLDISTVNLADPDAYTYSLPDGRSIQITQPGGVQNLTDANGNRITIGPNGLTHSAGKSVLFQRDAFNRITRVTDPAGNTLNYAYDLRGDLVSFADQEANATTYLYNNTHGLLEIRDPRGIRPIRNEYDDTGRLIRTIDAFGNAMNYTHNVSTRQEVIADRFGNVTVHEYDSAGNVIRSTDPLGGVTTRTYDARNNMLTETNPLNQTRTFTYDAQDNRLTETDPLGNTTRFTYDSHRKVLTTTDPLGRVTTNTYDANGNLLSTRDHLGNTTSYTYDSRGMQISMTDPLGAVTQYQSDANGNVTKQVDPLGNVTTLTYDANGNRLSETKTRTIPAGTETLVTAFQYDRLNRPTRTTFPDGSTIQTAYNSIGRQSTSTDQLGRQTSYTYDAMGRLIQTTLPDGTTTSATFDAEGRLATSVDAQGRTTSFQYDQLGRRLRTTFPDGTFSSVTYDATGRITQTTDERGNGTRTVYDAAGRRTQSIDGLNHTTTFAYDAVGNETSMTDARGNTWQSQYDSNNRRTRHIYPDGTSDSTAYDATGRTTSRTDQAGRTTQFQYDAGNRLTRVTDVLSQTTNYSYDEAGNRISQTDAAGRITRFEYDRFGRRTRRMLPLGMSETFAYDAAGNQIRRTDFNGRTTTYSYDSMNRLLSKVPDASLAEPVVSFTYTSTGRRRNMNDAGGATSYQYDSRDRLVQKATPQGTLAYTYDAGGNVASIRSSNTNGTSVDYTYDALNRLSAVRDNLLNPGITTYTYDAVGNTASFMYPNGVEHSYTYNNLNRLAGLQVSNPAGTLSTYAYTLAPAGQRTSVTELGGRQVSYSYDALYRLTNETIAGSAISGTAGYTYDAVNNRSQRSSTIAAIPAQTFTYDADDRLTTDIYDSNGNTMGSGADSFTYDSENRLTIKNSGAVSVAYDGDGNRVRETSGSVTTLYLVDDLNPTGNVQVLEELSGGTVRRVYTYGLQRISQSQASGTSFFGYDGHGSVRALSNAAGSITDRYDYDAFGNLISSTGTTPNNYLFAGEPFDPALGMYYNRARYLDVRSGRFWNMDTDEGDETDPRTLHKYTYANNNPVNVVDPSGNFGIDELSVGMSMMNTLNAISLPNFSQLKTDVELNLQGVQVCSRPLQGGPDWLPPRLRVRRFWRHTYIKILDPTEKYGTTDGHYFHTYGVLGEKVHTKTGALKGTPDFQQVRKDDWKDNSGSPPDHCNSCYTTPAQREALVQRLEYWALEEHWPCPSCGSNYRLWFQSERGLIDGYNSNTFTFNMLMQNPVGPIIPPMVSRAPGYHTADGEWYPTR